MAKAHYFEELFYTSESEDLIPGIAILDGGVIRLEPRTEDNVNSLVLSGSDLVSLVELYAHMLETDEAQQIKDAVIRGEKF